MKPLITHDIDTILIDLDGVLYVENAMLIDTNLFNITPQEDILPKANGL